MSSLHKTVKMSLSCKWKYWIIALTLLLVYEVSGNSSDADDHDDDELIRFKDVPSAVNYIHESLADKSSPEDKCKRYALLLALIAATGLPYQSSVRDIINLDPDNLNERYQAIGESNLSALYMRAIERYRFTRLAPPFMELIDCLNKMDTPLTEQYLANRELRVIVELYRQISELPARRIRLEDTDLTEFHPTFLATLRKLFEGYLDVDHLIEESHLRPHRHNINRESIDPEEIVPSSSLSPHQKAEVQRKRRVLRQQNYRERNLVKHREQARLAQRRFRMLKPEEMRERNRIHKQEQRKRQRQEEAKAMRDMFKLTPEERRQRRIERRRDRRHRERLKKIEEYLQQQQERQHIESQIAIEKLKADREPYAPPEINQTDEQLKRKQYYMQLLAGLQQTPALQLHDRHQQPVGEGPSAQTTEELPAVTFSPQTTASITRLPPHYQSEAPSVNITTSVTAASLPPTQSTTKSSDQPLDMLASIYHMMYSPMPSRPAAPHDLDEAHRVYHYITENEQNQYDLMSTFRSYRDSDDERRGCYFDDTDAVVQWFSDFSESSEGAADRNGSSAGTSPPPNPDPPPSQKP